MPWTRSRSSTTARSNTLLLPPLTNYVLRRSRPTASSTASRCARASSCTAAASLNADDVVASLKRWMEVSPRGKSVGRAGGRPGRQGAAHGGDQPEERLCAAAVAAGHGLGHGGHHGQGDAGAAAARVRRHRPLQVQGAQARPVRAADPLRRLLGAQGSRPAATAASARRWSRSCASCRCQTPTRASKAHWPASSTMPTCCPSRRSAAWKRRRARWCRC